MRGFTSISEALTPEDAARVHQRVPDRDEQHHPRPSPRHARQVHRRRDHGVLGRAGGGPAARAQRACSRRSRCSAQCAAAQRALRRARLAGAQDRHRREFRHGARRRHGLAGAARLHCDGRRGERRLAAGGADQEPTASASWSARPRAAGSKMWYSGKSTGSRSREKTRPSPSMSLWNRKRGGCGAAGMASQALRAYRARDWEAAEHEPRAPARHEPGLRAVRRLSRRRSQTSAATRRRPDWDGVTVFDEK